MRSLILNFSPVLHDHQITAQGGGARHRPKQLASGGGGYLENYTRLELSLSASEIAAAVGCVPLPAHWRRIADHLGHELFLSLWRRLEVLRTERRLRIPVPKLSPHLEAMTEEDFEEWLDAQRLSAAWFEIYVAVDAEQYRFIWRELYQAAYHPKRRTLRIYVPAFTVWGKHLKQVLIIELLKAGMPRDKIRHQLHIWLGCDASSSRLLRMHNDLKLACELPPDICLNALP